MKPLFNPGRTPSGAIPRFPIWEVTVMFFVAFFGFVGLITSDGASINAILGPFSVVWSGSLFLAGVLAIIGLSTPAPNGLIINLAAMLITSIASGAVLIAVMVLLDTLYFTGATSLYVFTVGSILRSIQLFRQLNMLRDSIQKLSNDPREYK